MLYCLTMYHFYVSILVLWEVNKVSDATTALLCFFPECIISNQCPLNCCFSNVRNGDYGLYETPDAGGSLPLKHKEIGTKYVNDVTNLTLSLVPVFTSIPG